MNDSNRQVTLDMQLCFKTEIIPHVSAAMQV